MFLYMYLCSVFILLAFVCKEIDRFYRNFIWSGKGELNKKNLIGSIERYFAEERRGFRD